MEIKREKKGKESKVKKEVSPTLLFGKWKDLDLDPENYRDRLWPRKEL